MEDMTDIELAETVRPPRRPAAGAPHADPSLALSLAQAKYPVGLQNLGASLERQRSAREP